MQSYTRTQATNAWYPEDTRNTFQVAKIQARMIKFHQKHFIESIHFENVNPDRIRSKNRNYRKNDVFQSKLLRFQFYNETENFRKNPKPIFKTQYSEIVVEYEEGFDMKTIKLNVKPLQPYHNYKMTHLIFR